MRRRHQSSAIAIIVFALILGINISCQFTPESQGKLRYERHCSSCHMDDGNGLKSLYPTLSNSDYLNENIEQLACIIKNGIRGKIKVNGVEFSEEMAGNKRLNDVDIANIINYVMQEFNEQPSYFISPSQVNKKLEQCSNSFKEKYQLPSQ